MKEWIETHQKSAMALTLLASLLYLLPVAVTGIDVCDSGFYFTFYRNIYSSPASVEYNFMYYLSGVVGGAVQLLFPSLGMLGWKLLGIATLLLSQWTVWQMLRKVVPPLPLAVGNLMVIVGFIGLPVAFCNDLLTTLLYCLALWLLHRGIDEQRRLSLLLSGIVLGVNIFSRLPNVLACVLALAPMVVAREGVSAWGRVRNALTIAGGIAVGVTLILLLMLWLGHYELFVSNLRDVTTIAGDESGESTHSAGKMIAAYWRFYSKSLTVGAVMAVIGAIYFVAMRRLPWRWSRATAMVATIGATAYYLYHYNALNYLWVLCFATCIWLLATTKERGLRLASLLGLAMMLIFPLGSDSGYNNGSIIAMVAAPVTAGVWAQRRRWVMLAGWALVCLAQMSLMGAYFDGGALWKKTHSVENARLSGVYTTAERATILNGVLEGIGEHVIAGDTLMAYGSAPLLNYLTDTRPAYGCSWPELLSAALLEKKLNGNGSAPQWILRQHFYTLSKDWREPTADWKTHYSVSSGFLSDRKLEVLNAFMDRNGYKEVWSNSHFTLYRRGR